MALLSFCMLPSLELGELRQLDNDKDDDDDDVDDVDVEEKEKNRV